MIAQHNLRYHLASTALRGPITFADLTPEALRDPAIGRVIHKVHLRVDPHNKNDFAPVRVSVTLLNGSTVSYTQEDIPGSAAAPLHTAQLADKAEQCSVAAGIPIEPLLARVTQLGALGNIDAFWS